MAQIIDGKKISADIRAEIAAEVAQMRSEGVTPGLAVIIVGENPASKVYVRNKGKGCAEVGMYSEIIEMKEETTQDELLCKIAELNARSDIHGILVQLPLPKQIDEKVVIAAISPKKDVDAFCVENIGEMMLGTAKFLPCTPAGIMQLLHRSGISVEGKDCVVIGRSNIVGKPIAQLLLAENGTVTICHSKTKDLASVTKRADILVVAIGRADFVTGDMVKEGAIVIDVGMNRREDGKLTGDVDFASVEPKAGYITPVPGGVGPMTITMLLKNTLTAARNLEEKTK